MPSILEKVVNPIFTLPDGVAEIPRDDHLEFLMELDACYVGTPEELGKRLRQLETIIHEKAPFFTCQPSFVIKGCPSCYDPDVHNRDIYLLAKTHRSRCEQILQGLSLDDNVKMQDGGIKSLCSISRKKQKMSDGERLPRLSDMLRMRLICSNLLTLDQTCKQLSQDAQLKEVKKVGCRNKYYPEHVIDIRDKNGKTTQKFPYKVKDYRCVNIELAFEDDMAIWPTEIQVVTNAMYISSLLIHPYRSNRGNLNWEATNVDPNVVESCVRSLIKKAGIRDCEHYLNGI